MSRKVFVIGETVWDIIFKEGQPQTAKAGGSMLNVAVSLGRLKSNVALITELGDDQAGSIIKKFLEENYVDTNHLIQYPNYKTSIALAFLNKSAKADYSFYKYLPQLRLSKFPDDVEKGDILMFGSYFAISKEVHLQLNSFISRFNTNDHCLIYDPNFRPSHLFELQEMIPMIEENITRSNIIRCSDEDMDLIYGIQNPDDAYAKIKSLGCTTLVYTASDRYVYFNNGQFNFKLLVPKINPMSTIGAGDSFNAAMINQIQEKQKANQRFSSFDEATWKEILNFAIIVSQEVCMSMDNYTKNRES